MCRQRVRREKIWFVIMRSKVITLSFGLTLLLLTLLLLWNASRSSSYDHAQRRRFSNYVVNKSQAECGYLISEGNSTPRFHPYSWQDIALRVIILTMNRAESLSECLASLNLVDYLGDKVHVDIWVDRNAENNSLDNATIDVANRFHFAHGNMTLHIRDKAVGVQGQWMTVWRPTRNSSEVALILEDDMVLSPLSWVWLKSAYFANLHRSDLSGISLSHPEMEHTHGGPFELPPRVTNYLYRVICTWGYAPHPSQWRDFQDWFYSITHQESFDPLVSGILPSEWYISEKVKGHHRDFWEMWHIYYTHTHNQFTLMLNSKLSCGLLAVNRHQRGLHDGQVVAGARDNVCTRLDDKFSSFSDSLPKYGYDGTIINENL